jgi:hypothetical protein
LAGRVGLFQTINLETTTWRTSKGFEDKADQEEMLLSADSINGKEKQ